MILIKIVGIICEYNPFHSGHQYQIDNIKEKYDGIICVMSGNFVQRGEVSILPKHIRARHAVSHGADLVIELPTTFATSSAERFAKGAISLLDSLNIITHLSFGSEVGDINALKKIADFLSTENDDFKKILKDELKLGNGFAKARENAIKYFIKDAGEILNQSNNILSIEYIKSLNKLKSNITPTTIKRQGALYNSLSPKDGFSSATAIRKMIKESNPIAKNYLSDFVFEDLINHKKPCEKILEKLILYRIRSLEKEEVFQYYDGGDGLFERIYQNRFNNSLDLLIENVKTKRFATSRIKRLLTKILIGDNLSYDLMPTYIRPLAMNKKGQSLLKNIKKNSSLPIVTKVGSMENITDKSLLLDIKASDIYSIICESEMETDFKLPVQIL